MTTRRPPRHLPRPVVSIVAVLVAVVVGGLAIAPGAAQAHSDFDYSLPTDGASVGEPVSEITVAFTTAVTLVGNGFAVLDPQNNELAPFAVTDDDTVFRLQFDPPLAGGTVAVKYEVQAEDGHVLTGNFVFVVDAPVPTTTSPTTTPPTTVAPTTVAPTTVAPITAATATATTATTTTATTTTDGASASVPTTQSAGEDDGGGSSNGIAIAVAAAVALAAAGFALVRSRTAA